METTLQLAAWGGSTALRIPKSFLQQLNMNEKSTVKIKINENNELIIAPVYQHITLAERFKDYKGDYKGEEIDWGADVGGEICD
jgi:antitoxin component of MazEF toxin-antitoxin module